MFIKFSYFRQNTVHIFLLLIFSSTFLLNCQKKQKVPSPSIIANKIDKNRFVQIINEELIIPATPNEKYKISRKTFKKSPFPIIWPYRNFELTSPYGFRLHPVLHTIKYHRGLDFDRPQGSPVYSIAEGKVLEVRYDFLFGNMVLLEHQGGMQSLYAHLSDITVLQGDEVAEHTLLGLTGTTGRSTGPHLHLGIQAGGHSIDPFYFLGRTFFSEDLHKDNLPWVYNWPD